MAKRLYRLRSMDAVLHKHRELELQEIHLSSPGELNDPMEGYRDFFWRGDKILWRNFLKHYFLCLVRGVEECYWMAESEFREPTIHGSLTEDDLPTEAYRSMFREALATFLADERVIGVLELLCLSPPPIRRDQLCFFLCGIHPIAVQVVLSAFDRLQGTNEEVPKLQLQGRPVPYLLLEQFRKGNANIPDRLWEGIAGLSYERRLAFIYNQRGDSSVPRSRKRDWVVLDFPDRYVDALVESLIHPPWHTACFSGTCDNASMWSAYGDDHRGIALVFEPLEDGSGNLTLPVDGLVGSSCVEGKESQPIIRRYQERLYEVQYRTGAPAVDFFKYIGRLPHQKIRSHWHCDEGGCVSPLVEDIAQDLDAWRSRVWSSLYESAVTKLPDWQHEQEYRMVVADMLGLRTKLPSVRFDFASLAGIVFGLRTSESDKLSIMEIVERKCRENRRTDFQFFQARYSAAAGKLIVAPMSLLRVAQDSKPEPPVAGA